MHCSLLQGTDLLLGAPGLRTWTGGFVDLRGDDSYILNYDKPATEISEMAGKNLKYNKHNQYDEFP